MQKAIENWQRDGFLVLPGALPTDEVEKLRTQVEELYTYWRQEATADGEPGGYGPGPQAWIMLHLNHPRYANHLPGWLPRLLDTIAMPLVQQLLQSIFAEPFVMAQANLYMDPAQTRIGNWHRDCQFFTGMQHDQLAAQRQAVQDEAEPPRELHMHIPLVPTQATEVVPRSHNRWDSEEEFRIRSQAPASDAMPGRLPIVLQPGDLAFFHVNSIHRGMYLSGVPRRTIAVTFGRESFPRFATAESMEKARGYNATYQPWFLQPGYLDGTAPQTRTFFQHFIDLYRHSWDPAFLTSLSPERQHYFAKTCGTPDDPLETP